MKYVARFTGRMVGAIGITYPISATVEASNPQEASLKLYDRYEHIFGLVLTDENGRKFTHAGAAIGGPSDFVAIA
jgi:hypothetical protein